jgi:hypothetical protein
MEDRAAFADFVTILHTFSRISVYHRVRLRRESFPVQGIANARDNRNKENVEV